MRGREHKLSGHGYWLLGGIFKHENKPSDIVKKKGVGLLTNR